jgi:hypothetical protein
MTSQPFNNNATPAERLQVHKDTEPPATFFGFAQAEADTPRGRFTSIEKATVIGVGPPSYPKGPDWTVDPVGPEPSLNFDVNQMPPTGEAFEVRRSLEAQHLPPHLLSPLLLLLRRLAARQQLPHRAPGRLLSRGMANDTA